MRRDFFLFLAFEVYLFIYFLEYCSDIQQSREEDLEVSPVPPGLPHAPPSISASPTKVVCLWSVMSSWVHIVTHRSWSRVSSWCFAFSEYGQELITCSHHCILQCSDIVLQVLCALWWPHGCSCAERMEAELFCVHWISLPRTADIPGESVKQAGQRGFFARPLLTGLTLNGESSLVSAVPATQRVYIKPRITYIGRLLRAVQFVWYTIYIWFFKKEGVF